MTPQQLFHLMSTHVKETATLSHSSRALDWDPPCSLEPGSRTDGAWAPRPSPPAGSKLSPTPGPPVTEGGRASSRGRPGGCRGLQLPGRPPLPTGRRPHCQAGAAWASPIFRPAPRRPAALGSPFRLSAGELRPGAGPGVGPGRSLLSRGVSRTVSAPGRRPPLPRAQPLTCRRRRRHSTLLQGGAPTRPGCGSLCSPPGQARGGAGASPERRNPPPGQPPPAPGSTRGRAGEGGRGGRRSPGSRTEPGARRGPGPGRQRGLRDRPLGAGQRPREVQEGPGPAGRWGPARLGATRVRRGGRGGGVGTAGAQDPPPAP